MMQIDLLLMYGLRDMVKQGNARGGSGRVKWFRQKQNSCHVLVRGAARVSVIAFVAFPAD